MPSSVVVREQAKTPDDQTIMRCITLEWPDFDLAANDMKSVRENNDNIVTFTGFEYCAAASMS